jgi:hypothetical protein
MPWLVNIALYNLIWWIAVLGGNRYAWLAAMLLLPHLLLSHKRKADLIMLGSLLATGLVIDGLLVQLGLFHFPQQQWPIPAWLMVIWLALATLPLHSLSWLQNQLPLTALLGALAGPLAYWAGVRFEAASFGWPLLSALLTLALVWGLLFPGIMLLARRLERIG